MRPFNPNNREAILAALNSTEWDEPICVAVASYIQKLVDQIVVTAEGSSRPIQILIPPPENALEDIALGLFHDFLASFPSSPAISIAWSKEVLH
jgi:hypothetical protein